MTTDISRAFQTLSGVDVDTVWTWSASPLPISILLRKLVGKHRQIALRFLVLLDAGRHDNAYYLAHILKGAVGLFGLTGIRSWAGAQEIAIHDGARRRR